MKSQIPIHCARIHTMSSLSLLRRGIAIAVCLCAWLPLAHAQTSYTLDITQPEHGTISVTPEMETYPRGTEVTLTAAANEGYRFVDLIIVRTGSGNENKRGRAYEENPRTFTLNQNTEVRATIVPAITPNVLYDNLAVRGDDPTGSGAALKSTFDRNPVHASYSTSFAQKFVAGSLGNVTSAEIGINRIGMPGGRLVATIREVDTNGEPGEVVGQFASFLGNAVPEFDSWCSLPLKLQPFRLEGHVDALEPAKEYFFHVTEDPNDLPQASPPGSGCGYNGLVIDTVSEGADGQIGEGSRTVFDWPWDPFEPSEWAPFDPNDSLTMRIRIEGGEAPPAHSLTLTQSDHGTVTASPEGPYAARTEVTLTATPNEGYQFSKWLIGEDEFSDNPVTFTIGEDTTVTPEFVESNQVIHFSNRDDDGGSEGRSLKAWATANNERWLAQKFTAVTDNVSEVSIALARAGLPGGKLAVSIWTSDPSTSPRKRCWVCWESWRSMPCHE